MPNYRVGDWIRFAALTNGWMAGAVGEILGVACKRGRVIYTVRMESGKVIRAPQGDLAGLEE